MIWSLPKADTYFAPLLERDPRGFQIEHLEEAMSFCERSRVAIDGGAHIGTWTAGMARKFERVVAFEPAEDTYECLKENVQEHPNVYLMKCALGNRNGFGKVVDDDKRLGNTGARYVIPLIGSPADGIRVVTLDSCELAHVDFIKLDVEGSELEVLQGAKFTIQNCRPVVVIEVKKLRPNKDPEDAARWLIAAGYKEVARKGRDRTYVPAKQKIRCCE